MAQTKTMWAKIADEVNNWRLRSGFGNKQVVIAEIGVQSKGELGYKQIEKLRIRVSYHYTRTNLMT